MGVEINLNNKVALVTGASRGIGHGILIALGQAGATVIGTATSESGVAKIQAALDEHQIKGGSIVLNVTDSEGIDSAIANINEQYGALDILVNNAGITDDDLMLRMKADKWERVINTDLTSIYRLSKACLRSMIKKRFGRIINIGSVVGSTGNPGQANYAAAKAGLIGFSKSLAAEIANRNVTVNVVAPGFIETDMTSALKEEQISKLSEQIPMARMGHTDDIANSVLFLASDMANYVTGHTLHVNGGMFMS